MSIEDAISQTAGLVPLIVIGGFASNMTNRNLTPRKKVYRRGTTSSHPRMRIQRPNYRYSPF